MRFILLCVLIVGTFAFATAEGQTDRQTDDRLKGLRHWEIASEDPDRIFLSFHGDATTTRAVTWRTGGKKSPAFAEIAKALGGPGFINDLSRIDATTERIDLNRSRYNKQGSVNYHSAVFEDLEPETLYAYRVGDGDDHWSEWIQFRTASAEAKPFKFVYFGDAQNEVLSHWSRTIRMANQKAPDAHFAVHAGDLINRAHADAEWAGWFKAGGFLHSQWSGIAVSGNHEYGHRQRKEKKILSLQWRPQFTLPVVAELPEDLHETVYTVDYQGMQVIVLNSNRLINEQCDYLESQLKKPGFRWRVVTFHHSMFSPRGRDSKEIETAWKPIFEKFNVDLVLQGHDHTYMRGQVPIRKAAGFVKDSFQTMYVTSVSGPKQYAIKKQKLEEFANKGLETVRKGEQTQFFQVIGVEDNRLTYEAYTSAGELYDSATITKDFESGEKTIRQNIPDIEERTFDNTPGTENSHD